MVLVIHYTHTGVRFIKCIVDGDLRAFFIFGKAEKAVPTINEDHVILQILLLDFRLLEDDYVCTEGIEHRLYMKY